MWTYKIKKNILEKVFYKDIANLIWEFTIESKCELEYRLTNNTITVLRYIRFTSEYGLHEGVIFNYHDVKGSNILILKKILNDVTNINIINKIKSCNTDKINISYIGKQKYGYIDFIYKLKIDNLEREEKKREKKRLEESEEEKMKSQGFERDRFGFWTDTRGWYGRLKNDNYFTLQNEINYIDLR